VFQRVAGSPALPLRGLRPRGHQSVLPVGLDLPFARHGTTRLSPWAVSHGNGLAGAPGRRRARLCHGAHRRSNLSPHSLPIFYTNLNVRQVLFSRPLQFRHRTQVALPRMPRIALIGQPVDRGQRTVLNRCCCQLPSAHCLLVPPIRAISVIRGVGSGFRLSVFVFGYTTPRLSASSVPSVSLWRIPFVFFRVSVVCRLVLSVPSVESVVDALPVGGFLASVFCYPCHP